MSNAEATGFKVNDYLERRARNPSFVMVELGYGRLPLVDQQPHSFTGQQAYIGIEAGMRKTGAAERALRLRREHDGINAFFLIHSLGEGRIYRGRRPKDARYRGKFKAETILPEGAADEVVASNVFCDWPIANDYGYTMALLGETRRLVAPANMIVLRETVSPEVVKHINGHTARQAGLEIVKRVTPSDTEDWGNLEQVYGTHYDVRDFNPSPEAYYLFLARVPGIIPEVGI